MKDVSESEIKVMWESDTRYLTSPSRPPASPPCHVRSSLSRSSRPPVVDVALEELKPPAPNNQQRTARYTLLLGPYPASPDWVGMHCARFRT